MTANEIVAAQIASFQADGLAWYDGISWLTAEDASTTDCDAAYERVFAKLIENGRAAGMRDPVISHAGNGHYSVMERGPRRSLPTSIVREVRRVIAPVAIRCALCKLFAGDDQSPPGVVQLDVKYNGDDLMPSNPLCALTRHKYICDDCVAALSSAQLRRKEKRR